MQAGEGAAASPRGAAECPPGPGPAGQGAGRSSDSGPRCAAVPWGLRKWSLHQATRFSCLPGLCHRHMGPGCGSLSEGLVFQAGCHGCTVVVVDPTL